MNYRIMTDDDCFSGLEYPTMEEAENKLKECPKGWWVDQWYYFYLEDMRQKKLIFDVTDINDNY